MRKILVFWASLLAVANPTGISPLGAISVAAAQATTLANKVATVPRKIKFDLTKLNPIHIEIVTHDFDAEIGKPLREAAKKARQKAEQARRAQLAAIQTAVKPLVVNTDDVWAALRFCEAGGDYRKNTGNGYFGAYQFDLGTWGNYGGYSRPDLAPPKVQDAKAQDTQARRGWFPWPACARRLGLI